MAEASAQGLALGRIVRLQAWALRAPVLEPVRTSFGTMHDRPAVWLALTGEDGTVGWGEVWCNFPTVGAEHRARLLVDTLAPLACGVDWPDAPGLQAALSQRLHVLALQTGEPGPLAQCVAGIDAAAWDLLARRAGLPLYRLLGGSDARVAVYASGVNPQAPERVVERMRRAGHDTYKIKVGFDAAQDERNLNEVLDGLLPGERLMVDANQAWSPQQARQRLQAWSDKKLAWVEEPIAADQPDAAWQALAAASPLPLAAGENLRGDEAFAGAMAAGALRYLQPDVGKWGGISGCLRVARAAQAAGLVYCPHWLGAGIGLMASLHLKAAIGGAGWVEIDANPNVLRDEAAGLLPQVHQGHVELPDQPGLGLQPALGDIERSGWLRWQGEALA